MTEEEWERSRFRRALDRLTKRNPPAELPALPPGWTPEGEEGMGDVKDAVKGSGQSRPPAPAGGVAPGGSGPGLSPSDKPAATNILEDIRRLADETSKLIAKKDQDADAEGPAAKPENLRKAAHLRSVYSMLVTCRSLLEDY